MAFCIYLVIAYCFEVEPSSTGSVAKAGKVVIKSIALIIQIIGVAPVCRSIREGIQGDLSSKSLQPVNIASAVTPYINNFFIVLKFLRLL